VSEPTADPSKEGLPETWVSRVRTDFADHPDIADRILSGTRRPRWRGLRINGLRGDPDTTRRELERDGIFGDSLPWFTDAMVVDQEQATRARDHAAWAEGRIILQSPSSLAAVRAMDARPGERILDLCAAPGGKSAAIAASTPGTIELVANDRSRNRCHRMRALFVSLGVEARVRVGPGERMPGPREGGFDRVLVDAPCSGEGRFHVDDPESWSKWSVKSTRRLASLQKSLLHAAIQLVRPGGRIVYSTCTLGRTENEAVVARALQRYGDESHGLSLDRIHDDLPVGLPLLDPPKSGGDCAAAMRRYAPGTPGTVPECALDGFFITCLVRGRG